MSAESPTEYIESLKCHVKQLRRAVCEVLSEKQKLEEVIARQAAYIKAQGDDLLSLRRRLGLAPHDFEPAIWRPGVEDVD